MKKFTLILGGVRSGKSGYAVKLAKSAGKRIVFIATCVPGDSEMEHRIKLHKRSRPGAWTVIEEGIHLDFALRKTKATRADAALIDCIGLFISNLMAAGLSDKKIEEKARQVIGQIKKNGPEVIVVSNETGMGIVPDNLLARRFRDLLGRVNQMMAKEADKVIMMCAGIPIAVKGGQDGIIAGYDAKN